MSYGSPWGTIKKIWSWVWMPLLVIIIAICFTQLVAKPTTVDGPSMEPNLKNGEKVWAFKTAPIHHGSVIVFNAYGVDPELASEKLYVKRVIGMPGDKVTSGQGTIYVNDRPINQSYISKKEQNKSGGNWNLKKLAKKNDWKTNNDTLTVPKGQYFVMGDHRSVSNDSRYFGFVPRNKVLGVVKVFWWTGNTTEQGKYNIDKQWKHFYQAGGQSE